MCSTCSGSKEGGVFGFNSGRHTQKWLVVKGIEAFLRSKCTGHFAISHSATPDNP